MRDFKVLSLSEAPSSDGNVEVVNVHFDMQKLEVTVGLFDQELEKRLRLKKYAVLGRLMRETC